ncbi:MAG: response regulator transcription factor [Lachnospiraceae bacterium]|nr:response regulator transcription factor [Lachnospiraceae bacterium]
MNVVTQGLILTNPSRYGKYPHLESKGFRYIQMRQILILEDNVNQMKILSTIVKSIDDVQVFEAHNVADANSLLYSNDFDVFLIDIVLNTEKKGDLSGIEFVKYVRDMKKYEFAPIIFITSLEDPKLCAYKDMRCFDYIEKPFSKEYVIKTIEKALEFPKKKVEKEIAYFKKEGILYSVRIDEVTHIIINRTGVDIYTTKDILKLGYQTATDILKQLDSKYFLLCNRSTIINVNYIEYADFSNRYIKVNGIKSVIEIGAIMLKNVKERLKEKLKE